MIKQTRVVNKKEISYTVKDSKYRCFNLKFVDGQLDSVELYKYLDDEQVSLRLDDIAVIKRIIEEIELLNEENVCLN